MLQFEKITRKFDLVHNNSSLSDFVPIACHYNRDTLLSKNGELIQIIKIKGINPENISEDISLIRSVLRDAIATRISDNKISFWIHTIRKKIDLSDKREYQNLFASMVNDAWVKKNFWNDKFVNELYISIVYFGAQFASFEAKTFIKSLSQKSIELEEREFLKNISEKLNLFVENLLGDLSKYAPKKLSIVEKDGVYFSELMKLYCYIIQISESECIMSIVDMSDYITSECKYTIGNDYLKIKCDSKEKFVSLISIKEYVDVPQIALADFLIYPIEFIITEVICFVDNKFINSYFKEQNYILSISKSDKLQKIKQLDIMVNQDEEKKFCTQQISIMLISNNIDSLNFNVIKASERLSKAGLIHVQEDINLERVFWSQLPSNFHFLLRSFPSAISSICAFTTLHSFPVGQVQTKLGKAITILRTASGTPYFTNFYDKDENGTNVIFGNKGRGKTILLNFLLCQANKLKPKILYITSDNSSEIFIKALGGSFLRVERDVVNPFIKIKPAISDKFLLEFFKIIAGHYVNPLNDGETKLLNLLISDIYKLPDVEKKLSKIIELINTDDQDGKYLKSRFAIYASDAKFGKVFESEKEINISDSQVLAFNLEFFDDETYYKNNYPKEKDKFDDFYKEVNNIRIVKAGIIYALQNSLISQKSDTPSIFVLDNISELLNLRYFCELIEEIFEVSRINNIIFFGNCDIKDLQKIHDEDIKQNWIYYVPTQFIIPPEIDFAKLDNIFNLSVDEFNLLKEIPSSARAFLLRQNGEYVVLELSIDGLISINRILSSKEDENKIFEELVEKHGNKLENWIEQFCNILDQ